MPLMVAEDAAAAASQYETPHELPPVATDHHHEHGHGHGVVLCCLFHAHGGAAQAPEPPLRARRGGSLFPSVRAWRQHGTATGVVERDLVEAVRRNRRSSRRYYRRAGALPGIRRGAAGAPAAMVLSFFFRQR